MNRKTAPKMVVVLVIALSFVVSVTCKCEGKKKIGQDFFVDQEKKYELRSAFVVYVHGPRTPSLDEVTFLRKDFIEESHFLPYGLSAQTHKGNQVTFNTGAYLNKRYGEMLGYEFNPDEISFRCTDYQYSKVAALSGMVGLVKPDLSGPMSTDFHALMYDYYSPKIDDLLFYKNCPKYKELQAYVYVNSSEEIVKELKSHCDDLLDLISAYTVEPAETMDDILTFSKLMTALKNASTNKTNYLPRFFDESFQYKIGRCVHYIFKTEYTLDNITRISSGVMLERIHQVMALINYNYVKLTKKLYITAGHARTLASLIAACGIRLHPHLNWQPKYGSIFSLDIVYYPDYNEYGVKAFYLAEPDMTNEPFDLYISGCENLAFCKLSNFMALTRKYKMTRKEFRKECLDTKN